MASSFCPNYLKTENIISIHQSVISYVDVVTLILLGDVMLVDTDATMFMPPFLLPIYLQILYYLLARG